MSRYIDADKLKTRLDLVSVDAITLYEMGINAGLHRAEAEIELLPTADVVEVRHGHWIDKSRNINGLHDPRFDCSVCGHIFWFQGAETFNYCPACGAKMDGERREENER